MNINAFLKKHAKLDYWLRAIKYSRNQEYVQISRAIFRDPNLLYFASLGNEYPDTFFYDLYIDAPSKGFFALLNQTLDGLKYADRHHLTPVVTWSDACLYKEDSPVNGTENPFYYFFSPFDQYDRSDVLKAKHVLKYNYGQRAIDADHQFSVVAKTIVDNDIYDSYIRESAETYRKYIHLKEPVLKAIDDVKEKIGFSGSVIGVHVRATDSLKGYINHAIMPTSHEYIEAVKEALQKGHFDKIFLATDDAAVIKEFETAFPEMVIYNSDSFRSEDGSAVHFSKSVREHHKYSLGVEVITDMYMLSICNGLVGGYSNVCIAAQIAKKSYGSDYEYMRIIDKGFNTTGITVLQDHSK